MRRLLAAAAIAALTLPFAVAAQQAAPPPQLEPIPEPPPERIGIDRELAEQGVTLQPGDRAERFEVDGQQYIHVTTAAGTEYYLVEAMPGFQPFAGASPDDSGVRVPMWRIFQW